jgi:hypothetical protein
MKLPPTSHCWKETSIFFSRYSDLLGSSLITAIDIIFLLGEAVPSFPKALSNTAFTLLNVAAIIPMSFYISLFRKHQGDLSLAYDIKKTTYLAEAASKTMVTAADILLPIGWTAAAIYRMANNNAALTAIYTLMKPIATCCIITHIALEAFTFFSTRTKLPQLRKLTDDDSLFQGFVDTLTGAGDKSSAYGLITRMRMDKDTWNHFHERLQETSDTDKQKALFHKVALNNLSTQQKVIYSQLFLRAAGYAAMLFSAWHAGTIIQASIWTAFSGVYTSILLYQKIQQHQQRQAI